MTEEVLNESTSRKGDSYIGHNVYPLGERYGIAILHPINLSTGRYLEEEVVIPRDKAYLYVGLGIAGALSQDYPLYEFVGDCVDVGVRISLKDEQSNKERELFNKILKMKRGEAWKDYRIPIPSDFSGKKVKVRIESYAADSGCGKWNGEWLVVDYVCIKSG